MNTDLLTSGHHRIDLVFGEIDLGEFVLRTRHASHHAPSLVATTAVRSRQLPSAGSIGCRTTFSSRCCWS
jgi:hypothetical protein